MLKTLYISFDVSHSEFKQLKATAPSTIPNYLKQYAACFSSDLGLSKGFVHKVVLKSTVKPGQLKVRRPPIEFREKVSAERHKLKDAGTIERTDPSKRVSPIVVAWLKTGEIRLCVDLRQPNQVIVVDSHLLPHLEEVFSYHDAREKIVPTNVRSKLTPKHLTRPKAYQTRQSIIILCTLFR